MIRFYIAKELNSLYSLSIVTPRYPSNFQRKTLWNALTGMAILILGALLTILIWLTGMTLGLLQPVILPLAVAGIIAYLLDPIVTWLQNKGLSRLKSVIAVFASFLVIISIFAWTIIPPISKQLSDENNLNATVSALQKLKDKPWVSYWLQRPTKDQLTHAFSLKNRNLLNAPESSQAISKSSDVKSDLKTSSTVSFKETRLAALLPDDIVPRTATWLKGGTSKLFGMFGLIIGFTMLPIYLYYFLKESSGIKAHWHEYIPLKASHFKTEVVETLSEINGYLISFFRGQVLVAFIDGILVGISLFAFGLPYGLVIGMSLAILGIIPYIGNILCLIPACIIAYVHFSIDSPQGILGSNPWIYVAAVCLIFFIVQQINSLVTAPKIVGDSVGLHPMTVIFSMLFWSILLGGFIGAILAIPLTAAIKVLFRRYVWEPQMMKPVAELPPTNADSAGSAKSPVGE